MPAVSAVRFATVVQAAQAVQQYARAVSKNAPTVQMKIFAADVIPVLTVLEVKATSAITARPVLTAPNTYATVETVAPNVQSFAKNVPNPVKTVMLTFADTATPARTAWKITAGATNVITVETAFPAVPAAAAVLTA